MSGKHKLKRINVVEDVKVEEPKKTPAKKTTTKKTKNG